MQEYSVPTLGQKIKSFRKRAGLSQLELETAISAAPGSISRIEADKVNPTKETVVAICETLQLNHFHLDYLIGPTATPATETEIESALAEVESYFNQKILAYLIDERWRLFKCSGHFLKMLNLDEDYIREFRGRTTAEFLTSPELGIQDRFSAQRMEQMLRDNLQYYWKEVGFMQDDPTFKLTVDSFNKNPVAAQIWQEVVRENSSEYPLREGRKIYFNALQKFEVPLVYNYEYLLNTSRFKIVIWTPENKFVRFLSNLLA